MAAGFEPPTLVTYYEIPPALILSFNDLAMGSSSSSGSNYPAPPPPILLPPIYYFPYNLAFSAAILSSCTFLFLSSSACFFLSASSLRFLSNSSFFSLCSSFLRSSSYLFFSNISLRLSSAPPLSVEVLTDSLESLLRLGVGFGCWDCAAGLFRPPANDIRFVVEPLPVDGVSLDSSSP